jgi:hypothetical protein
MKLERPCIIVHVREEEFYIAIAPPVVGCSYEVITRQLTYHEAAQICKAAK